MALISIKRNVDLQPGLNAPAVFNCSQSDKGTTIMLGLMNGGNDYTVPSGVTITIRGSRSNGAVFTPVSATSSGSTVSFTLTEEMTDTAGPTLCEAVLEQGNNVLGTANFIINVEGSPMGADVPPVFTDAAWTWMLGKLTTETVPALGDDVISSIQGKVDKSQGSTNAKKFLRVNTSGNVSLASTDKTLSVADQIADAKETGDQIRALDAEIDGVVTTLGGSISTLNGITTDLQSSKLYKNQGTSNAGKTMVVDSSGNIVPGDVPITIDDTLSIADAAADAKAAGDAIALKANASTIAPEFSDQNTYTAGSYVYKNGVLYRFTSAHSGAWTGNDAEVVTVGGEVEEVKNLTISALYGNAGSDFPIEFENGTYRSTTTGQSLEKYYGGGYDLTRKVIKTTTFDAPCKVVITAKTGYAFTVLTSANGVITGITGPITSYVMTPGNQYGMTLRTTGGTDNISALDASQIINIEYIDNISESVENISGALTGHSVNFETEVVYNVLIGSSTNKWNASSGNSSYFIPVNSKLHKNVAISAGESASTIFAFLKSDAHASGTTPDYADGGYRASISAGDTVVFKIPDDCKFVTVLKTGSGNDYTPKSMNFLDVTTGIYEEIKKLKDACLNDNVISLWNDENIVFGKALSNDGSLRVLIDYDTTDFIDVANRSLLYGFGARYCFYDENKTFMSGKTGVLNDNPTLGSTAYHYVEVPNGAYYFRICELKTGTKQIYSPTIYDEYLKSLISATPATRKLYCLGDSITRGMYAEEGASSSSGPTAYGYPYWIGQYSNYDVVNLGNSGSGWANVGTAETAGDPSTARNAKDVVDDNTFDDADIITMAWGVNDWKGATQNVVLGDMTSEAGDGTVIGNMKYCIETLVTKKATAQLIVLLPMNTNRQWSGMREMTLAENWAFGYPYRNNQTLEDYRTAIRQCAEYYNIKVIDLEEVCPINRLNLRNCCGDGLHPTKAFHKQMGRALANLIC